MRKTRLNTPSVPCRTACAHLRCIFIEMQPVILSFSQVCFFSAITLLLVMQAVSKAACKRREALMNINGERCSPLGPVAVPCVSADAIKIRREIS